MLVRGSLVRRIGSRHQQRAATSSARPTSPRTQWWSDINRGWKWNAFRKAVKAARAVALAYGLYTFGYMSGAKDASHDPQRWRRGVVTKFCAKMHMVDENTKEIMTVHNSHPEDAMIRRVLPRLLDAARAEVKELAVAAGAAKNSAESTRLRDVAHQLEHWDSRNGYIFLARPDPNACVHGLIPRMIFVHWGLFDCVSGVRELNEGEKVRKGDYIGEQVDDAGTIVFGDVIKTFPDGSLNLQQALQPRASAQARRGVGGYKREAVRVVERQQLVQTEDELAMILLSPVDYSNVKPASSLV